MIKYYIIETKEESFDMSKTPRFQTEKKALTEASARFRKDGVLRVVSCIKSLEDTIGKHSKLYTSEFIKTIQ